MRLIDAPNTHNPALMVLRSKGYTLSLVPPTYDPGEEPDCGDLGHIRAEMNGREFIAGDGLALLGLVALWESRGDVWRDENDSDVLTELISETYSD